MMVAQDALEEKIDEQPGVEVTRVFINTRGVCEDATGVFVGTVGEQGHSLVVDLYAGT
jgi:hypothetical protein